MSKSAIKLRAIPIRVKATAIPIQRIERLAQVA
jgi:hypothetical protein